ncbi:DMT family transporter [Microlunatus parietis]|uniref:Transporter family-2 protein n=1 Tax=Microlunatus parietis TaxID=682979 RepID=A0A7Y9I7U1_9ACTN|nr:DMT family transporter [Microlunatus parietis]NYE71913.1 transporter family-2 protein [Microlunatus parietis]
MRTTVDPGPTNSGTPPIPQPVTYSPLIRAATIPALFGIGALVSIQSKINSELAQQLGTGLRAAALSAVISFGTGLVLLSILVLVHPATRRGVTRLYRGIGHGEVPLWLVLGGLAGGLFVASQGLSVGILGVALFIVAFVAGQSTAGLVVDHHGLGPGGRRPVSRGRMIGAALAVVAVALSAIGSGASTVAGLGLLVAVLPLVAGMGTSVQQALNGRVALYAGSWATTFNNFVVGFAGLAIYFGISLLVPGTLRGLPSTWWLYLGGSLGIVFIWASSILVRIHGVLILGLGAIAGQVVSAIVIDLISAPEELTLFSYLAAAVTLIGVAIATLLRPRRPVVRA